MIFNLVSTGSVSGDDVVKPGTLISGVVERVTPDKIIISVDVSGYTKGILSPEHLADNQGTFCSYSLIFLPCCFLIVYLILFGYLFFSIYALQGWLLCSNRF